MKYCFIILLFNCLIASAQKKIVQKDSTITINSNNFSKQTFDTSLLAKYSPRLAIKRSAMLPGWGQYTNKKIL